MVTMVTRSLMLSSHAQRSWSADQALRQELHVGRLVADDVAPRLHIEDVVAAELALQARIGLAPQGQRLIHEGIALADDEQRDANIFVAGAETAHGAGEVGEGADHLVE